MGCNGTQAVSGWLLDEKGEDVGAGAESGEKSIDNWPMERLAHIWLARAPMPARERHSLKGDSAGILAVWARNDRGLGMERIRQDLERWRREGIEVLVPGDALYQRRFGRCMELGLATPYLLYMKGNPLLLEKPAIAFVGSREAGPYGRRITRDLVDGLWGRELAVISGGARGVDTFAHQRALEIGLPTICVLGCGIGCDYPPENRALFRALERDHLVLSEYEPHSPPRRYYFPERNRIIAQLAQTVVVTAASLQSGSLITAEHAMDCGVPVLTVPWAIYHPQGAGCHFLLATGAGLISSPEQFREVIGSCGL